MRGFTGQVVNGHRVFVRSEFEDEYWNYDELERIEVLTGTQYASLDIAMNDLYNRDESLVYRNFSRDVDMRLRDGDSGASLWIETSYGWVHKITGELVTGCHPDRDSYPCWCLRETDPYTDVDYADDQNTARLGLFTLGCEILASILGRN